MANSEKLKRLATVTGVTLGVYMVFKYILPKVAPFILAWALCGLLYKPLYKIHEKTRIPLGCLGTAGVGLAGGLFFTVSWYFIASLVNFVKQLFLDYPAFGAECIQTLCKICNTLEAFAGLENGRLWIFLNTQAKQVGSFLNSQGAAWIARNGMPLLTGLIGFGAIVLVGLIAAVILIRNRADIAKGLSHNCFAAEIYDLCSGISRVVGRFFKTQGIIMICTGVICIFGLWVLQNPYALFLGIAIALLDALPVIGSGTILLPWTVFSILQGRLRAALGLGTLYFACTCLREVLEPKLMGDSLGINPFFMLMATFVGLGLFGLWGILLGPLGLVIILEILHHVAGKAPKEL